MMDADGTELFAFEDITWQTAPPPDRHPIPAQHLRDLDIGDELTIGIPGRYFINGQILLRTDRKTLPLLGHDTPHESLAVCAPIYYWTWQAEPARMPIMQWWPVDYTWAYRDAVRPDNDLTQPSDGQDDPSAAQHSWLDRVRPDTTQPPVLRAIPAREAGSLMGRTLRSRNAAGQWFWFIAVSEPVTVDGDICVHAVTQPHWWLHQMSYYPELQDKVKIIPIHRLFAYL